MAHHVATAGTARHQRRFEKAHMMAQPAQGRVGPESIAEFSLARRQTTRKIFTALRHLSAQASEKRCSPRWRRLKELAASPRPLHQQSWRTLRCLTVRVPPRLAPCPAPPAFRSLLTFVCFNCAGMILDSVFDNLFEGLPPIVSDAFSDFPPVDDAAFASVLEDVDEFTYQVMSFDDDYSCASAPAVPAPAKKQEVQAAPAVKAAPVRRPAPPRAKSSESRGQGSVSVRRGVRALNHTDPKPASLHKASPVSHFGCALRRLRRAWRRPPAGTGLTRRTRRSRWRSRSAHSQLHCHPS